MNYEILWEPCVTFGERLNNRWWSSYPFLVLYPGYVSETPLFCTDACVLLCTYYICMLPGSIVRESKLYANNWKAIFLPWFCVFAFRHKWSHGITTCICGWWGLILAEICPAQRETLHNLGLLRRCGSLIVHTSHPRSNMLHNLLFSKRLKFGAGICVALWPNIPMVLIWAKILVRPMYVGHI